MPTPPVDVPRNDNSVPRTALLALLLAIIMAAAAVMPRLQAKLDTPLAVVFPPWWSAETTLTAAAASGVDIVGSGLAPNILIVRTSDAKGLGRLYARGAWSVLSVGAAPDCDTNQQELRV